MAPTPVILGVGNVNGAGQEAASWADRSSASGVVWAHNFDTATEVDQFRWQGGIGNVTNIASSDGNCRWVDDGFDGGGCCEINIPTGGTCASGWWRPLSALFAGDNGKATDDPAANGTLIRRSFEPAGNVNATYNFMGGYYGHSSYHALYPTWTRQSVEYSNIWDGTEYYLQFRCKISASRFNIDNPAGKLVFLDLTSGLTGTSLGEIVLRSEPTYSWVTPGETTSLFRPYGMFGDGRSFGAGELTNPQGGPDGGALQPGYNEATCKIGTGTVSGCWYWPADEWVTVMVHVKPGRHSPGPYTPTVPPGWWSDPLKAFREFQLEIYVARAGETEYTLIHSKSDYAWLYGDGNNVGDFAFHPPSHNSVALSGYMNGVNAEEGWYHRFAQVILSKQFIPPPLDTPQWVLDLSTQQWTSICLGSGGSAFQNGPTLASCEPALSSGSAPCATSGTDFIKIISAWNGGVGDNDRKELRLNANGGHGDYVGNGCFALQLNSSVPRWIRQTDPTPASFFNGDSGALCSPAGAAQYNDGRTRSCHTANTMCYGGGYDWMMGQSATAALGHSAMHSWRFDRANLGNVFPVAHNGAAGPWQHLGAGPALSYVGFSCAAWDPVDQKAWGVFGEENEVKGYWSANMAGTLTTYTQSSIPSAHFGSQWACVDPVRRRLIVSSFTSGNVYVLDLTSPASGFSPQTCTGGSANRLHQGAVYHAASDAILTFDVASNAPGTLNKLNLSTFAWSTVSLGGTAPTNQAGDDRGTNSKFQLFEFAECTLLVVVTGIGAGYTKVCKLVGAV